MMRVICLPQAITSDHLERLQICAITIFFQYSLQYSHDNHEFYHEIIANFIFIPRFFFCGYKIAASLTHLRLRFVANTIAWQPVMIPDILCSPRCPKHMTRKWQGKACLGEQSQIRHNPFASQVIKGPLSQGPYAILLR